MTDATKNKAQELKLQTRLANQNTSHILHLILSIITVGIWIPVWILVAVNNAAERARIISKLAKLDGEA